MKSITNHRELEKSVVKTYGSLCLALFATGILTYNVAGEGWWLPLVILGGLIAIFSVLVWFGIFRGTREQIVNRAAVLHMENITWFLAICTLGIAIIQLGSKVYLYSGLILVGIAYVILLIGIGLDVSKVKRS